MSIRTFTAESMTAAYALVKRRLGDRAVILHTRTIRRGGLFGFGAKTYVQIIAGDERDVRPAGGGDRKARGPAPRRADPAGQANAGDLIRKVYAAARAQEASSPTMADRVVETSRHDAVAVSNTSPPVAGTPTPEPRGTAPSDDGLRREMKAVRRMVSQMMHAQSPASRPAVAAGGETPGADQLFDHYLGLLEQDVSEEIADEIVDHVRQHLSAEDAADPARVREAVAARIESLMPVDDGAGVWSSPREHGSRTIALVGPTGVGKTTTVAKMAANYKLKGGCNVGLITIDTYRIAAVDQLRTYADIIGVPLHVVLSPRELGEAVRRCAGCDVILIDTAGRSQRDGDKLEELESFMAEAQPDEVHLVLASTSSAQVILDTVERFSRIAVDRVIFTKLDEAVTVGVVLNASRKINKRLSFVTTGQDVPHHIEPGRASPLVARMLGEGK